MAREVLTGLEHAHQHKTIHRDIKPSNIFLDASMMAKIADFGIASIALQVGVTRYVSHETLVTAQYMSPEEIERPLELDHRTDIYSMGIVLYELLTGKVPFDGSTVSNIQQAHLVDLPPPLRSVNSSIPETVERCVLKALEKDPQRRYSSCRESAESLPAQEPLRQQDEALRPPSTRPSPVIVASQPPG